MTEPVVRMWEARTQPEQLDASIRWVLQVLIPSARAAGAQHVDVCYSKHPDPRIVTITQWSEAPTWKEPEPDTSLVARWHAWDFHPIDLERYGSSEGKS